MLRSHHQSCLGCYLTQRPAGIYWSLKTNRREERTEEELRVHVTLDVEERDPGHGLLGHLVQGVVVNQVGQTHLCVTWNTNVIIIEITTLAFLN